ncbi:carbohydrate ABC transporter permease [uncultured Sphaerochaeta sp.]|uniref:carbohydrate ABC transporter permease n=1 Tax=uncultured Sphaerochaeta sp. TaxID=886478 RepID=UPI002A0A88E6|nr:carbohydrate ABC transporter permease [uncultured Sphaerochaeta sp.]
MPNSKTHAGSNPAYHRIANLIAWTFLTLMMIWLFLPMIWSVTTTFKTAIETYRVPVKILPENLSFHNYIKILTDSSFPRYLFNTVYLTVVTTLLTVIISIWPAYAFSRMKFKFQHILLLFIMIPRLIPRISVTIPLYKIIVSAGLLNTYTALIITYTMTSLPFAVWILSGVFQSIPKEIEESAFVDGAQLIQTMFRIMIPIASSGVVTVIIFTVREAWNEFPFVLSFTNSATMRTLPYQLYMFRDTLGIEDWPLINTFAIITIIPILVVYFIFSKKVTSGIIQGALK